MVPIIPLVPLVAKLGALAITGEALALAIKHKRNLKEGQKKATAELKNSEELRKLFGYDGMIISENIRLKEKYDFEHLAVIAPTGSGKTTKLFYPNLLDSSIKGSLIIIDPKGELYRDTSNFQRECGRRVLKFSPLEPSSSEKYNLLEQCEDTTEVIQLASTLLLNGALSIELMSGKKSGGVEWIQMAEPLLSAALLFVRGLEAPYNSVEYAFKTVINSNQEELDLLLGEHEDEEITTQYNIFKTVAKSANTAGSIKVTLASNLKLFTDKNINYVNSNTTFTAQELRKEPTALYITFPERKSAYLAPYLAPFFSQFIDKLLDTYSYKSEPIHFFMDEFPNIGLINNMSLHCATVRSRRISFTLCMQSITQLYQTYGHENGKAILNNLKTKIILPALSDSDSLQYIEGLCGKCEISSITKNESEDKTSTSTSTSTRNVLNMDEIRRLDDNKVLIVMSNKQPVTDEMRGFYEYSKYNDRVKTIDILENKKINFIQGAGAKYKDLLNERYKLQERLNENKSDKVISLSADLFK